MVYEPPQPGGPLSRAQIRFLRQFERQFALSVKENRSKRFVSDLVLYMLEMHFRSDPIFRITDDDERRWIQSRLEKVRSSLPDKLR